MRTKTLKYTNLCTSPKSAAMTPTCVSIIIFNALITPHLVADRGAMTLGLSKMDLDNNVLKLQYRWKIWSQYNCQS